jgi:hypothetical protein
MKTAAPVCGTICGELRTHKDGFMLTENQWTDRLKILSWNETLVGHQGYWRRAVQPMCSRWLFTGWRWEAWNTRWHGYHLIQPIGLASAEERIQPR